jgi:DNA-binding protein HU-beta
MNRRELVNAVAAHAELDNKTVDQVLIGFTDVVTAVVAKGEPVSIPGFLKLAKVSRPARMGRNPATGEAIKIKASKKVRVTAFKNFKDAVMGSAPAPSLARGVWPPAPKAAPAKKTAAKKTTAVKKTAAKKTAVKKTAAKKTAAKKTTRR